MRAAKEGSKKAAKTAGVAFVEFLEPEGAQEAVRLKDNFSLDVKHKIRVNLVSEYEELTSYEEEYVEPNVDDIEQQENPSAWLEDELGRDQYVIRQAEETEVFWNDPIRTDRGGRWAYTSDEEEKHELEKLLPKTVCCCECLLCCIALFLSLSLFSLCPLFFSLYACVCDSLVFV